MEKLGLGDARQILTMLSGEEVASSKLSPRMAGLLRQEGLLLMKSNGSRCKYRMADAMREPCRVFLTQQFGLKCSLEEWIGFRERLSRKIHSGLLETHFGFQEEHSESIDTRSELVEKMGDSKYRKVRTFRGFLVDCYMPIEANLNHRPFLLNPQEGSSVFINAPETFEIPEDVVVVGMENAENFMQIRKQKYIFDASAVEEKDLSSVEEKDLSSVEEKDLSSVEEKDLSSGVHQEKRCLFVSRYPQENLSDLRAWLMRIPNRYIHFGDFDLAGVHIYLSEFYAHLGDRASFFIPSDIEERLADGNPSLYDQQYARFKNMEVTDARLQPLVDMIHRYRKGYEQEGYI